ncbi:SRPBCC family protein [Streptomonospora arabica]|uniref:SRPBCC family protein n=1 Tax=Streptomonospora arabica TaxID=412417 RepID=A0ABV9SEV9_9ACTN
MIDVDHQISAVRRRLGTRMLDAGEARVLTIGQTYEVRVEDVWDALTNPERIPRWFLPVSGDLREGGHYRLEGNAGGTITACDPPTSFTATWESGGQVSWIEVGLAAEPAGTRLELVHIAHVDDEAWESFGPGAAGVGWDMALMGLGEHLAGGESADAAEIESWMASDEGRRFVELSSDRWRRANVEFGTGEEAARAAADRTTAAYIATEEPEGRG